jgi:HAD superfamily hydrolase (TIGR01450 family)
MADPDLARLAGVAFDLDGTIWAGEHLMPGATACVEAMRAAGLGVVFVTNGSRESSRELAARLTAFGIPTEPSAVLAAIDLLGDTIRREMGPARVLPLGSEGLARAVEEAGHTVVGLDPWEEIQAVALGNDAAFDYAKLAAASQAVRAGAGFFTCNLDPRLPLGPDGFDPGCGSLAEAIAVAAGVRPTVVGKPNPPIFTAALERLGCAPGEAAMVGDRAGTDIAGGRAAGMITILVEGDPEDRAAADADLVVKDPADLLRRWKSA